MKDHPLTQPLARHTVDLLRGLVSDHPKPEALLESLGWTSGDLKALAERPTEISLGELLNVALFTMDFPGDSASAGPNLPEVLETDRSHTLSQIRQISSNRLEKSEITDKAADEKPILLPDVEEKAGRVFMSFLRQLTLALVRSGKITWDDVLDNHRKTEKAYRIATGGLPLS